MSAWRIDTLKSKGLEKWIHRVNARIGSITGLIGIPASLIGAVFLFIYSGNEVLSPSIILIMKMFFLVHGLLFLLNFFILYFKGREIKVKEKEDVEEKLIDYFKRTSRVSSKFILKNKIIFVLFITIIFFYFSFSVLQDAWQPYLTARLGFNLYWLGIASALTSFFGFLINIKSKDFTEWVGNYPSTLLILTMFLGFSILIFAFMNPTYFVIVLYVVIITAYYFYRPIRGTYIHNQVPSKIRATIGSIDSFLIEISTGFGSLIIFGIVGEFFTLSFALKTGGIILIGSAVIYVYLIKEN